ncbi:hypothetical protein, partial [Microbacterium sp. CnD16-F]|uniref:2-oxoglutarate dehydrogenase E1 subunit family protein n=1 Tax=Microbacterium sp. CnD16-F TaxID=2954493 RepID=UPI0035ABB7A8
MGTTSDGEFGANEWLVAELYEQYSRDKNSVDKEWWPILEAYTPDGASGAPATASAPAGSAAPAPAAPAASAAPAP